MELNQILRADLLDILFEGRNKSYGAYDLRKTYNRRLTKAIVLTISLCLLLILGYVLAGKMENQKPFPVDVSDPIVLINTVPAEKIIVLPPPPMHKASPRITTMSNIAAPRIVRDIDVKPPPTEEQVENMNPGTMNRKGIPDDGIVPTSQSDGLVKGLLDRSQQKEQVTDGGIVPVEIESYYIGGTAAWSRFLTKTLRYPQAAADINIQGTVIVQFVVDKEGMITEIQAISGPDELRAEAVRAIRTTQGKWYPGIQNGRKVKSYKKQPITFLMDNGN